MTQRKATKFCSIQNWLIQEDSELYDAITQICATKRINPSKYGGITFIVPDKATRKAFIDAAYNDHELALAIFLSHVVSERLVPERFQSPIGSKLGILFNVKSISAKSVKIVGNAGKDIAITPIVYGKEIAIWQADGQMPLTGDAYKPHRNDKKAEGGAADKIKYKTDGLSLRTQIALRVERDFPNSFIKGQNIYLAKVISLLCHLQHNHKNIFNAVLPLIDRDPIVTFYILLEPYKRDPPYILPCYILSDNESIKWDGSTDVHGVAVTDYKKIYSNIFTIPEMKESQNIRSEISKLRDAMGESSLASKVAKEYNTLAT